MHTFKNHTQAIEVVRIKESLNASVIVGDNIENMTVSGIYASDLMSDVLAYGKSESVLLSGLNSLQTAISAYMAEFKGIIFIRGKIPDAEVKSFAKERGLFILSTDADMYEACVEIASVQGELSSVKEISKHEQKVNNTSSYEFHIDGSDFASAGMVSTQIKTILKSIGFDPKLIRRIAISTYEAEMNVVMHAKKATVTLIISNKEIIVLFDDEGKGITDIEKAMTEGYSTATEEQRAMGFGAGMGLPNIKRNSDKLNIRSAAGQGTFIEIIFYVQ